MEEVKIQLIDPRVELIEDESPYKVAELCGRVCYKSEEKITADSWKEFLLRLAKNEHTAMLEHATIYLDFTWAEEEYDEVVQEIVSSPYSTSTYEEFSAMPEMNGMWHVTTNLRVLFEIWCGHYPDNAEYCFELALRTAEEHKPKDLDKCTPRYTLRFTCDRGVSHELVRHRVFSFAQESTRYCRYDKRGFLFIKPSWYDKRLGQFDNLSLEHTMFLASCQQAAETYSTLLSLGETAQEARAVLPNAIKTEVCMTGTNRQWAQFFKLRCAPSAHPDMQIVANAARELLANDVLIKEQLKQEKRKK